MGSVVISGATSGAITLAVPAEAGAIKEQQTTIEALEARITEIKWLIHTHGTLHN
jgi:hypothetical protein